MRTEKKTPSDSLIVKDNKLINARYSLSVAEMRLFLMMVAQVRRDDMDFKTYRIKISDFIDKLETQSKSVYDRAREKSKRLMEKVLEIEEPDGKLQIALLSSAKYYSGKGYVELRFDPALKPYLLQLKEKFTSYDIRYVLKLQSSHSIRIYELLKQYERLGERIIGVEELKEMLDLVGKYRSYNYFKKRVIIQAQDELEEKTDIRFTFEEIKEGRRVVEIRFLIHRKKEESEPVAANIEAGSIVEEMQHMGLSHKLASKFSQQLPSSAIRMAISYTQEQFQAGKIKSSVGGYLRAVLEAGGVGESQIEQKTSEKQQQQVEQQQRQREEAERIREWQDRFDELRRQQVSQLVEQAQEADWQSFLAWAADNLFVKAKVFVEGKVDRQAEDTLFWFHSFLSDRLPSRHEAFLRWVYEETGYQLRRVQQQGEEQYIIEAKQAGLFD